MERERDVNKNISDRWNKFEKEIADGMLGLNIGIPIGFDKLSFHLCNIQPARYDLIGGATGTGKTAFVDGAYLYNPIEFLEKNPDYHNRLKILYFSIEIPPERKLAKLVCQKLYDDYGIQIDVKSLFSRGSVGRLDKDIFDKIRQYRKYYENILDTYVDFYASASPNFIYKKVLEHAEKNGTLIRDERSNAILSYTPNDPKLITLVIIDHISLVDRNKDDKTKKEAMDRLSKMLVTFRNDLGFSPVVVSQFNRSIEGMDRKKYDAQEPQLSDFKDTGATQEDADSAMALFNPHRYNIENHRNYNIKLLARNYRSFFILKNRDGEDNLTQGLLFMGTIGKFRELPSAKKMMDDPELYNKVKKVINNGTQNRDNGPTE